MTLFSGDLFSPSRHSTIFRGEQLIGPINRCDVDVACLGNHDLDFGIEQAQRLIDETNFPWLLSNLFNKDGTKLVNTKEYHIIKKEGLTIGVMGLAEIGWVTTTKCIDIDEVIFEDFVEAANRISKDLRELYACDYIIALTHMRVPNDILLAQEALDIDLILGGHDHVLLDYPDIPPRESQ